ncbi:hypothetical protein [Biformimicrobium ophioploci]|uniref:Uncharacterized protein n=1 Tax=Biformimicrobium ophioploci TaxID=3036711 RepID=A0ABQ6LWD5_9GAMM|nr:hypothetical protein [Microbulbifer sp. NKW57]GMG86376.1 hypothetical protein MNKW57_06970 [Microbulbifer sp. NKW57]
MERVGIAQRFFWPISAALVLHLAVFYLMKDLQLGDYPSMPGPDSARLNVTLRFASVTEPNLDPKSPTNADPEIDSKLAPDISPVLSSAWREPEVQSPAPEAAASRQIHTAIPAPGAALAPKPSISKEDASDAGASDAKINGTVFDPRLRERIQRAQSTRSLPADSGDIEEMTAQGTFIRRGDYCAERRALVTNDIDFVVYQDFKVKCSKRKADKDRVDRLAERFGIP